MDELLKNLEESKFIRLRLKDENEKLKTIKFINEYLKINESTSNIEIIVDPVNDVATHTTYRYGIYENSLIHLPYHLDVDRLVI